MEKTNPRLGALRIFDGVFSDENCDDLVNIFKLNLDLQKSVEDPTGLTATGYEYTRYHFEEEFHSGIIEQVAKLYGKYLEEPTWRILGGSSDEVRVYADGIGYYDQTVDEVVKIFNSHSDQGYEYIKYHITEPNVDEAVEKLLLSIIIHTKFNSSPRNGRDSYNQVSS